jgi:type I restriction enzyme S subunit
MQIRDSDNYSPGKNGICMELMEINEDQRVPRGYKQTEVGVIPKDWEVKFLKDISEKVMVGIASAATHAYRDNGIVLFRNQNIKPNFLDDSDILHVTEEYELQFKGKRLKGGDLLTARTGYPGTTCVVPYKYENSQSFTTLITRPIRKTVLSQYLSFFINSEQGNIFFERSKIGGGQKNVNAGILKFMQIPLPPTLAEQRAIATVLSDTDALLQALEKKIAKKKGIKKGVIQELLRPKEGWVRVKLDDEIDVNRGGSPRPIQDYITGSPNGINWIKIGDTSSNSKYITSAKEKIIEEGAQNSRRVNIGDFLLSNSMSFGRPYILKINGCIHDGWLVLQKYQESFDREFLYYTLMSEDVFKQYLSKASGSGVLNLNKELVKTVELNKPKDIREQVRIATVLSDMDKEIENLEQKLSKYQLAKEGMMQKLLTGKIRLV